MTQEAIRALEIIKLGKKYKEDMRKIKQEYPLIDHDNPKDPINDSTYALWEPYIQKYTNQGMVLFEYCKDNPSIKTEFEEESKKIEAKIKAEKDKYFKNNKAKFDSLKNKIDNAKKCEEKREKMENIVNIAMSALLGLWIVAYIVLLIVLPVESILHRLMIEGILLLGIGPVIGLIFLRIFVNTQVEHWAISATQARVAAEKEYEQEEQKADDKVAHLTTQLREYKLIIGIITDTKMPII